MTITARSGTYLTVLTVLGLRHLQCPHCFEVRLRPYGWLRLLLLPFWGAVKLVRALTRA